MITQERLKELLHYNPNTGIFTWLCGARRGQVAGGLDHGYIRIRIYNKLYYAHRLACLYMTGNMPCGEMDHIDGVRDNNRWANLRDVSRIENTRNKCMQSTNKSGVVGISWEKDREKWLACISTGDKTVHLGRFDDFEQAVIARKKGEVRYNFHKNHGRKNSDGNANDQSFHDLPHFERIR